MPYGIKEVFLTLQGEGARAGAKSVFVRMTGCNLWSGNPAHRERGAGPCARWCDTDFFKGEQLDLEALRERMRVAWGTGQGEMWCVITGGEPALQIDQALVDALHADGWRIAVETNGTLDTPALRACDHVCVSPKRGTSWSIALAHEIKVVLPGAAPGENGWTGDELVAIEREAMAAPMRPALFVQPQDPLASAGELEHTYLKRARGIEVRDADALERAYRDHLDACVQWVMHHDRWRLSAQLHKYIRIA